MTRGGGDGLVGEVRRRLEGGEVGEGRLDVGDEESEEADAVELGEKGATGAAKGREDDIAVEGWREDCDAECAVFSRC